MDNMKQYAKNQPKPSRAQLKPLRWRRISETWITVKGFEPGERWVNFDEYKRANRAMMLGRS